MSDVPTYPIADPFDQRIPDGPRSIDDDKVRSGRVILMAESRSAEFWRAIAHDLTMAGPRQLSCPVCVNYPGR